jgi:hypothetical protein
MLTNPKLMLPFHMDRMDIHPFALFTYILQPLPESLSAPTHKGFLARPPYIQIEMRTVWKVLERLAEIKAKAEGTIFEEFVSSQVENYKQQKQKELKKANINNKWIDHADALFNLFAQISEEVKPQIEPFVAHVEFVDNRESDGAVMLTATNFQNETFSLRCADLHTMEDYAKLEDDAFVETLDEAQEEGGVQFFFDPDELVETVPHSRIFKEDDPLATLKQVIQPHLVELLKRTFDISALLEKEK